MESEGMLQMRNSAVSNAGEQNGNEVPSEWPTTHALIYTGDQVGRVADALEAATEGQPIMQVISAVAQSLERFAEFMEQVAPEDGGTPYRSVRGRVGIALADAAVVEPSAITNVRDGLDALAKDMADLLRNHANGVVDAASVGALAERLRDMLG